MYIMRSAFLGLLGLIAGGFSERLRPSEQDRKMNSQPSPTAARQILWPSVVTVISAAILIGAEVFGAAFAGGWALAILFGLGDTGAHILQAVLFAVGVLVMIAFIRAAQRVEPFTRRA
jgi:nitric oxide reductase large subunit